PIYVTVAPHDGRHLGVTQPRSRLDQDVQYWLQVEGRAADRLQHVTGRRLVFERLLEVARALAQFSEQARILHRDDRLRREILQRRDLPFGEWPHLLAVDCQGADRKSTRLNSSH